MGRAYSRIYFHLVFSTKYREEQITYGIEKDVHDFMKKKLEELGCTPIIINGMPDHVHILFRGKRELSISKVVMMIKGTSSYWINRNNMTEEKFEWQEGYSVFSVSEFHVRTIFQYIKNQKTHHRDGEGLNPFLEDVSNPSEGLKSLAG